MMYYAGNDFILISRKSCSDNFKSFSLFTAEGGQAQTYCLRHHLPAQTQRVDTTYYMFTVHTQPVGKK